MTGFSATFLIAFKSLWRDPINVTIMTAFPILLILVLGTALSSFVTPNMDFDPLPVAVVADENDQLGLFLSSEEISAFIEPEFMSRSDAEEHLENQTIPGAIFESDNDISVVLLPGTGLYGPIVLSIIDSYKQIGAAATMAAMSGRDIHSLLELEPAVNAVALGNRLPSAIDYYAVTMLVMILLFTGFNGMEVFNKGLLGDTGNRTRTSPIRSSALVGGLLAASTITSFIQGMITFVFAGVVYGVYWGERIPLVLLTLFAVVLLSQSFCIFLIMVLRNQGAVIGVTQAVVWVTTFISQGYVRFDFGELDRFFQYAPNAMAQTVIFGSIFGGDEADMMFKLAALFGVGFVLFVLAFLLGRRRIA